VLPPAARLIPVPKVGMPKKEVTFGNDARASCSGARKTKSPPPEVKAMNPSSRRSSPGLENRMRNFSWDAGVASLSSIWDPQRRTVIPSSFGNVIISLPCRRAVKRRRHQGRAVATELRASCSLGFGNARARGVPVSLGLQVSAVFGGGSCQVGVWWRRVALCVPDRLVACLRSDMSLVPPAPAWSPSLA
jgi:hypothetical protein